MATTEAMQILEGIKDTPGWNQMRDAMQREKKATWQQILAVHTSTCCQPHKASGVVESLEEAGLRYPLTGPGITPLNGTTHTSKPRRQHASTPCAPS